MTTSKNLHHSESLWDLLPDHLITEILIHLPSKPLCRFKSVSKRHYALISHPHFITSYISRSNPFTWAILDRLPPPAAESTHYATRFDLLDPPEVSTPSINPYKLVSEPETDLNVSEYLPLILGSSNGLVLFTTGNRDPTSLMYSEEEPLYVVNLVTNEWSRLPPTCYPGNLVFTTRIDLGTGLVEKFLLAGYKPVVGSESAKFVLFNSDTGKWVDTSANYMLGNHIWQDDDPFEFEGRLFWVDLGVGLITWDAPHNDPFVDMEGEIAVCRFIPLPSGCVPIPDDHCFAARWVGGGGGFIQYIEVFYTDICMLKVWRLKDCVSGGWSLEYKVSEDDLLKCFNVLPFDFEYPIITPLFVHPYHAEVVYFEVDSYIFSLNVGTLEEVKTCSCYAYDTLVLRIVVPKWPSPLPKGMCTSVWE